MIRTGTCEVLLPVQAAYDTDRYLLMFMLPVQEAYEMRFVLCLSHVGLWNCVVGSVH